MVFDQSARLHEVLSVHLELIAGLLRLGTKCSQQVSFEHPKHMLKLEGKKIFTILCYLILVYLNMSWDLINVIIRIIVSIMGHANDIYWAFIVGIFPDRCCIETGHMVKCDWGNGRFAALFVVFALLCVHLCLCYSVPIPLSLIGLWSMFVSIAGNVCL